MIIMIDFNASTTQHKTFSMQVDSVVTEHK